MNKKKLSIIKIVFDAILLIWAIDSYVELNSYKSSLGYYLDGSARTLVDILCFLCFVWVLWCFLSLASHCGLTKWYIGLLKKRTAKIIENTSPNTLYNPSRCPVCGGEVPVKVCAKCGYQVQNEEGQDIEGMPKYNVVLIDLADVTTKIKVIKEVRTFTGLGLADAKAAVEACPFTIREGVPEVRARHIKQRIEMSGAVMDMIKAE